MADGEDRFWITRVEAARVCELGDRTWDGKIRPRLPSAAVKGNGAKLRFHLPAVVKAIRELDAEQLRAELGADPDGGDSPTTERGQLVKTQLLELTLAERMGQVVRVEIVQRALAAGFVALRGVGDQLVRQYGNEAGELYNEGIGELAAAARAVIELADRPACEPGGDGDLPSARPGVAGEGTQAPDDRRVC